MYARRDTHFDRTYRRVPLSSTASRLVDSPPDNRSTPSGITLDRAVPAVPHSGRLVAYHDAVGEKDYVALAVGVVFGENDIPVRSVEEELLVLTAARCVSPEILIGSEDDDLDAVEIERQLRVGGPVRALLEYTGALSVVVGCLAVRP